MATEHGDRLLRLWEVALITDIKMRTLKEWTSGHNPPLKHEHVGPGGRRIHVRRSELRKFYPEGCLHLERLVAREAENRPTAAHNDP